MSFHSLLALFLSSYLRSSSLFWRILDACWVHLAGPGLLGGCLQGCRLPGTGRSWSCQRDLTTKLGRSLRKIFWARVWSWGGLFWRGGRLSLKRGRAQSPLRLWLFCQGSAPQSAVLIPSGSSAGVSSPEGFRSQSALLAALFRISWSWGPVCCFFLKNHLLVSTTLRCLSDQFLRKLHFPWTSRSWHRGSRRWCRVESPSCRGWGSRTCPAGGRPGSPGTRRGRRSTPARAGRSAPSPTRWSPSSESHRSSPSRCFWKAGGCWVWRWALQPWWEPCSREHAQES